MDSSIIWCQHLEIELKKRQEFRVLQAKQREESYQEELKSELERMRDGNQEDFSDDELTSTNRVEEIE
jgi:hypothetical protein